MEFTEPWKDPLFERAFELFYKLDIAENVETVMELLEQYKFTQYELNRINSPCLDGLIAINREYSSNGSIWALSCIQKWCHFSAIEFSQYKDTFLYVLEKTQEYELLLWHIIYQHKFDLVNLYCDNVSTNVSKSSIGILCHYNKYELLEKLLIHLR
jgi:hypothetical protein